MAIAFVFQNLGLTLTHLGLMLSCCRTANGQYDLAHFQLLKAYGHHGYTYQISTRLLHFYDSYRTFRRTDGRTDSPTVLIFCDVTFSSILSRTFTENLKSIA